MIVVAYCYLFLISITQVANANELIAKHGDWSVTYGDQRKSVVTVTLNANNMIFGFGCALSKKPDCTIGAHLPAQCGNNTEVSADILIDAKKLTTWTANCENTENPTTGESDRVFLSSKLTGESVDALLAAMRAGKQITVAVESTANDKLQSTFSLNGYSKAASEMYKVLGWDNGGSNGIGGDDGGSSTAKQDLEQTKWKF
jgi:invasion protein IalB